jgi:molybdate transport system substrate-binding protein
MLSVSKNLRGSHTVLAVVCGLALLLPGQSCAAELRIAVASNFTGAMSELAARFEENTGHEVKLSTGSTGKHYAQIINGAPFDLFFAADVHRPELLEAENHAVTGTRFTYAVGKLVLWSPDPGFVDAQGAVLRKGEYRFLAIANPRLAPYGRAAREVLDRLGLWEALGTRIVRGENIAQAYQFVSSGNAELGFIASSQVSDSEHGSSWDVPREMYTSIRQQAVLLKDTGAGRAFIGFVRSEEALRIIGNYGYFRP